VQKPLKILVVRFSSIGDIVLTTPVVRMLKKQLNTEVHFLTKSTYVSLLKNNPYIDSVYQINHSINEVIADLKKENYDYTNSEI
jgi:ADP-heptose:LPS heptosyltransferase